MNRRRMAIVAGIGAALVALGVMGERHLETGKTQWGTAVRDDLVISTEISGTLAAVESDLLGPPQIPDFWDFKISQLAAEGTTVRKGQPVIGFDTSDLQRQLQEKLAESQTARKEMEKRAADLEVDAAADRLQLAEARASLRKSELKLEAPGEIVAVNERKQATLDRDLAIKQIRFVEQKIAASSRAAKEEIDILRNRMESADARVKQIESSIEQMNVRAPRDGTVILIPNWRNQKKKVGDSCWRGERIAEIPNLRRMMAKAEVDESDAGRIAVGQRVVLRLDSRPDEELVAKVSRIATNVQKRSRWDSQKVLKVDLSLARTDPETMRPGMRFRGDVEFERIPGVVLIPEAAVFDSPQGPVVIRRGLFGNTTVPVRLGRRNRDRVEVISGVDPGTKVLLREQSEEKS
ncbi:MAG: efflux RND transporter periplasmic adaptor subunit [Thermoanaerobaculia bacterium]